MDAESCTSLNWVVQFCPLTHFPSRAPPRAPATWPWSMVIKAYCMNLHYICNLAVNTSIGQIFVEVRHRTAEGGGSLLFVHMYDNVRTGLMYTWIHTLHYVETLWQYFQYCPRHYRLQRRGSFPLDVGIVECWDVGMYFYLLPHLPGVPGCAWRPRDSSELGWWQLRDISTLYIWNISTKLYDALSAASTPPTTCLWNGQAVVVVTTSTLQRSYSRGK